ncbi:MAG: arabinan endo-1,5-alpha-L-arabinosidase [Spirochaetales bacterium]|nr:arabinan endo-1,5-alpha-L-arabinosidase [Spirochaetales bacterium]
MSRLELSGDIIAHDPTIVFENGAYWRFQTGDRLPFFRSADLQKWESAGRVFESNPAWTSEAIPGSTHFWAPEVVFRNGEWRVYYSVSTFGSNVSAIGLAASRSLDPSSADYGWIDRGPVVFSQANDDFNAIDAAVFTDSDDRDWFVWGSFWGGIRMRALDRETGMFDLDRPVVTTLASKVAEPNPVEGAFVLPRGDWYYLFVSHDFCCRGVDSTYKIVVGRSSDPEGPYFDREGRAMAQGGGTVVRDGSSHPRWAGPGHCSVYTDNGANRLVYHAYDRENGGKPVLQIEKIEWTRDEWPYCPE